MPEVAFAVALSTAIGCCIALGLAFLWSGRTAAPDCVPDDGAASIVLEDGHLVDATDAAERLLLAGRGDARAEDVALARLEVRFDNLRASLASIARTGRAQLVSRDGTALLRIRADGRRVRLSMVDAETVTVAPGLDSGTLSEMERELDALRSVHDSVPFLVWRQRADGTITWINRTYLDTVAAALPERAGTWPPPALFEVGDLVADGATPQRPRRLRLTAGGTGEAGPWFECHFAAVGGEVQVTAVSAEDMVAAEETSRGFVMTLSKTFANLTTGLAVFGKDRRLALFNPALTDLTGLPVDRLLSRPTLFAFLDALRSRNVMPEPKDYRSWRARMADLEAAASEGPYTETWHLPDGRCYRLIGHPQPDGALALLFEDISAEIGLSRSFRAELEVNQAILDSLDEAVAVFDLSGTLTLANRMYEALWEVALRERVTAPTAGEAVAQWQARSAPSAGWGALQDCLTGRDGNEPCTADMRLLDGRALRYRVSPLPGRGTLVRIQVRPETQIHEVRSLRDSGRLHLRAEA
ncbi:PAS domain-containing protein [Rhodobacteraceae bacterium CCMM004]|nr:PAS domain-containing protein [Rhodobacteraceae bacterium CCMM004]